MEHSDESHGQKETWFIYAELLDVIRVAIRDGATQNYERLRQYVLNDYRAYEISSSEAHTLLRTLDILMEDDEEERLKLMLELTPDLLQPHDRARAVLEHKFREDNKRRNVCFFLQLSRDGYTACMKSTQEGCTEQCPARRTGIPVSAQVTEQEPVLA